VANQSAYLPSTSVLSPSLSRREPRIASTEATDYRSPLFAGKPWPTTHLLKCLSTLGLNRLWRNGLVGLVGIAVCDRATFMAAPRHWRLEAGIVFDDIRGSKASLVGFDDSSTIAGLASCLGRTERHPTRSSASMAKPAAQTVLEIGAECRPMPSPNHVDVLRQSHASPVRHQWSRGQTMTLCGARTSLVVRTDPEPRNTNARVRRRRYGLAGETI
jgi:hypothetical protein